MKTTTLRNVCGFSLIEALVAAALASAGILGTASAVKYVGQKRQISSHVNELTFMESQLLSAMTNSDNYSSSVLQKLNEGTLPENIQLNLNSVGLLQVTFSQPLFLTAQKTACSSFEDFNCIFRLKMDLKKVGTLNFVAYQIALNPKIAAVTPLGTSSDSLGNFADADYRLQIPQQLYADAASSNLNCKLQGKLIATGMNGGKLDCINPPREPCATNSFGKGLKISKDIYGSPSLELNCVPAAQYCCPEKYSLQVMNLRSTDRIFPANDNYCVYAAKDSQDGITSNADFKVHASACPDDYESVSTCNLVSGNSSKCSASLTQGGRNASCSVTGNLADCSNAKVIINVKCRLTLPQRVPATVCSGS